MAALNLDNVLRSLLDLETTTIIDLELTDPIPWDRDASLNTKQVDDLLLEAEHEGLTRGRRQEGDGSASWWSNLELTVRGLRQIGEWPPADGEFLPGVWDSGCWGQTALPRLQELDASPPEHGFIFHPAMGASDEEWQEWQATRRLLESGLIRGSGGGGGDGISNVGITAAGRRALDRSPGDPLDRAAIELQRDAKADAMTAAVEEVLRPRLLALADTHGVPTKKGSAPVALGTITDQLAGKGVLRKDVRAEIAAYLQLRNATNHGRGAQISATRIARAINGIRELRDEGLI